MFAALSFGDFLAAYTLLCGILIVGAAVYGWRR